MPQNINYENLLLHGTTTLAFIYQGGVIVSVDSRASAGTMVATQNIKKIIEFSPKIIGTMAGSAAACQHAGRRISNSTKMFKMKHNFEPSVRVVSRMLQSFFRECPTQGRSGIYCFCLN